MGLLSLRKFTKSDRQPNGRRKSPGNPHSHTRRLRLESLECRRVLAALLYVDNAVDFEAEPGSTVTWNPNGFDHQQGTVTGLTPGTNAFTSIQDAINAAGVGDNIFVAAGTYSERLTVGTTGLQIVGDNTETTLTTVVDYTGQSAGQAGVYISGDGVQLLNVAVTHDTPNASSVPRYGIKADFASGSSTTPVDGVVIDNVEVSNSYRTGLDLNGVTNITVSNFSAINNGGAGIFMTDVKGAELSNLTTSGNPWVGVSIATYGKFFPLGTSGITFSGTNSFAESASDNGGLQLEMGNFASPGSPEVITWSNQAGDGADVTIQSSDFGYMVSGHSFANDNVYRRFYQSLGQAQSAALGSPDHIIAGSRYIQDADDSNDFGARETQFYVYASDPAPNAMSIQGAIDAAVDGDGINIAAGTFNENVSVNKSVSLQGAGNGAADTVITAPGNVVTIAANDVSVRDLRLTGGARGVVVNGASATTLDGIAAVGNSSYGIEVAGTAAADLEILNSTLSENNVGFRMGTAANLDGLTIAESTFADNTLHGIAVFAASSGLSYLTDVEIRESEFVRNGQKGMYFEKLDDALIDDVSVIDSGVDAAYAFNNGIDINLKYADYANITIQCSTFSGSGVNTIAGPGGLDFAAALAIKARGDASSYNTNPATLSGVLVQGNRFEHSDNNDMTTAVRIGEPGKTNAAPTDVVLRGNDLSDGSFTGVDNTSETAVDAVFNWWGTTDGTAIESLALGDVDFAPWLLDSAFSGNNLIFTGAGGAALVVNQSTGQYAFVDDNGDIHEGSGASVKDGTLKIHDQSSSGKVDVTGAADGTLSVILKGKGKPRSFTLDSLELLC